MKFFKKNLYIRELKSYRKSLILWFLFIAFFAFTGMSKYQGYAASDISINELFKDLPQAFTAIWGIGELDLNSAGGFYAIMALYTSIMLGIHAVLLGAGIISKEENDKTAEFLFVKPISRLQGFATKLAASSTILVVIWTFTLITSMLSVGMFNEGASITSDIIFLSWGILFIQFIFLAIGILFASMMKSPKKAGLISSSVLLSTFVLSGLVDMSDKFEFFKYITPFKYFDSKQIFATGEYEIIYIVISLIFIAVSIFVANYFFKKRDFNI